jgi:hypothetical protein
MVAARLWHGYKSAPVAEVTPGRGGTGIGQTATSPNPMMPIVPLGEGVRSHEELLSGRSLDVFVERIGIEHAGE